MNPERSTTSSNDEHASAEQVVAAARLLEQGQLVAFPTETVYGLGADAENPAALAAIYAAKGRPSNHPVIVHLAPEADIGYWAAQVPDQARRLIECFWPGPLTLILQRAPHVATALTGGQDSVGLRCPSHPVAQALLREFRQGRGGIAGPSANKFGHVSPTTARHVIDEFGSPPAGPLGAILEGGQSMVGIESTIIDLSRLDDFGPALLRPGHIGIAAIEDVLGRPLRLPDAAAPRVSGSLDAHYAPRTPLALLPGEEIDAVLERLHSLKKRVAMIHHSWLPLGMNMPEASQAIADDADGFAFGLYAALRAMDRAGVDVIILEAPPRDSAWQGINDRLRRAAHDSAGAMERMTRQESAR
ncbi:MAG: L-threonylcarbamoyladenylate synthase [Janthinobacterium lividum]